MKARCRIATGLMALMMAASGCGNGQEAKEQNAMLSQPAEENGDSGQQSGKEGEDRNASESQELGEEESSDGNKEASSPESIGNNEQDTEIIGGKGRSIAQDSFVISRVLMDGSYVIMPEAGSPEEELVTIRCTDSTTYERWTIQGGGAGIDKEAAAFADILEGGGLEASGYFDGEEFVAQTVFIEIYE